MHRTLGLLLLASFSTAAWGGGLIVPAGTYQPLGIMGGIGFKDSVQKDGTWRIVANSRRMDGEGFSLNMALYRAAELASASGHRYVQILMSYGSRQTGTNVLIGTEFAKIVARSADTPEQPTDCISKKPGQCFTADVQQVLARIGPRLVRPD